MGAQCFLGVLHIQMPVAQAIERTRQHERIIHSTRKRQRTLKIVSCLRVIEPGPEIAKIEQALPFHIGIMRSLCHL